MKLPSACSSDDLLGGKDSIVASLPMRCHFLFSCASREYAEKDGSIAMRKSMRDLVDDVRTGIRTSKNLVNTPSL